LHGAGSCANNSALHGANHLSALSELRGLFTGFGTVAALLLVGVSIDFGVPGQELLSSLRFHLAAAALVLPILLLVCGARLRALALLGLIILSLAQSAVIVLDQQARRQAFDGLEPAATLRVLSYNVLNGNRTPEQATRFIAESGAAVVVVMEALGLKQGLAELAETYPYRLGCDTGAHCDLAILSRTPLQNAQIHRLYPLFRHRLAEATVTVDGQSFTLVALHLSKPYFDEAAPLELLQAERVIKPVEGPLLLMGDFNAAAWSNNIARFANQLDLVPPPRYPGTWPVSLGPAGVPIDNMFTRGPAAIRTIEATGGYGSNHLGLIGELDLYD
jgi:endonuclease/exonuclease/phosphatase (EEP) superfamily protein YafD